MDVGCADTAGIDGNVDIVLLELLEGKLQLFVSLIPTLPHISVSYLLASEGRPVLDVSDRERVSCVWVTHDV